jgi:hypothetical protein
MLTVDMDAWWSEQMGTKNRGRNRKDLDARQNLYGYGATDIDVWWTDLQGTKERVRKGRLEAMGNLQRHRDLCKQNER